MFFIAHPFHGFQADAKSVDGAYDTYQDAQQYHPSTHIKPLPQPDAQPNKSSQGCCNGDAQLGQPNQKIDIFHSHLLIYRFFIAYHYILTKTKLQEGIVNNAT